MPNSSKLLNYKINLKRGNVFFVFIISTLLITVVFNPNFSDAKAQSVRFKISGYVLDSNGLGIPGADVIFNAPSIVPGVFTDASGYYETYGPSGTFYINVWPPFDSNYINGDEPGFVVASDTTKNITLRTGFKISGYVTNAAGAPMMGASVLFKTNDRVYGSGWFTTSSGYYFISVPAGTYIIDAHPQTSFNPSYTGSCTPFPTYYEYNFVVEQNINRNITVGETRQPTTPAPSTPISYESISDDWSMYRHDPQGTGSTTNPALSNSLIWNFNTRDKIHSSPAIANGIVYQGSNDGYIYALNATSGSLIWQYNTASQIESSPAVANGILYIGLLWDGHNGYVVALNAATGSLVWRFSTNSGIESSPTVLDDVVYIGSYSGYVYALNASNGVLIWSYSTGSSTFSSPAVVNGIVYIGSNNANIYALNTTNGTSIWIFHASDKIYASPAVVNNIVYVGSDGGNLYALRADNGSKIWQSSIGVGDHSDDSPAVSNGIVYFGSRNGYYALNATTGEQIWFFTSPYSPRQLQGYVYSSPAISGDLVYFGSCDSYVFALNAFNGSIVWSFRTGGFLFASPAVANGALYIGAYDGYIYAIGTPTDSSTITNQSTAPTPTPTQTPTPTPTPTPTSTPQPTANPTLSPITSQTSYLPIEDKPTPEPDNIVESSRDEPVNWYILGGIIIIIATAATILFNVTFIKK